MTLEIFWKLAEAEPGTTAVAILRRRVSRTSAAVTIQGSSPSGSSGINRPSKPVSSAARAIWAR